MRSLFEAWSEKDDVEFLEAVRNSQSVLPLIDKFWQNYEPYANAKFSSQFRTNFLSRLWELWLGNIFLAGGFRLREKKDTAWPDFSLEKNSIPYYVEAVCPENASEESGNRIPELNMHFMQEIRSDLYELRLQNAILEKYQPRYLREIQKLGLPYIVAVNGCKLPHVQTSLDSVPLIVRTLYPVGSEIVILNQDSRSFETARQIKKSNARRSGFEMTKCFFSSDSFPLISAIIYTNKKIDLTLGKISRDVFLIKNPHAKYKVENAFGLDEIVVEWSDTQLKYHVQNSPS